MGITSYSFADLPPNYYVFDIAANGSGCFDLPEVDFSKAFGINNIATAAVGEGENICPPGGFTGFFHLIIANSITFRVPINGPDRATYAVADGQQSVGWSHDTVDSNLIARPTFLGSGGIALNLDTIGGSPSNTGVAYDLDDALRIVGQSEDENGDSRATYWENNSSSATDIGAIASNTDSSAHGKNTNNDIVGWSFDLSGNKVAILWESTGTGTWSMISLETLGGDSIAFDINDSKIICGSSVLGSVRFAVKWEYDDINNEWVITNLGVLPGGTKSEAFAINNTGDIIGQSRISASPGSERSFLWSGGTMFNLNDKFCRYNVDTDTNWVLHEARDINNNGDIAGWGFRGGVAKPRPFVLKAITCTGDINGDGVTDVTDLLALLASWDDICGPADLDNGGTVSTTDLLILLADWGCGDPSSGPFPEEYGDCFD